MGAVQMAASQAARDQLRPDACLNRLIALHIPAVMVRVTGQPEPNSRSSRPLPTRRIGTMSDDALLEVHQPIEHRRIAPRPGPSGTGNTKDNSITWPEP